MTARRFIWFDFETWGLDQRTTPIASFAAVVTDERLIEQARHSKLVRPLRDRVLSPTSSLITHLTPTELNQTGMGEHEFAQWLHALLNEPIPTTLVGFNNSHYDNKVVRFLFFRNLLPAYTHEQQPNATLDALEMLRLAYALRPSGMQWPTAHGAPTFRLDALAAANDINHSAHTALGDVVATLELVRRLQQAQPSLFSHILKQHTLDDLQRITDGNRILLYVDRYAGHTKQYLTPVMLLPSPFGAKHRLALNMRTDYSDYANCDTEQLMQFLATEPVSASTSVGEQIRQNIHSPKKPTIGIFSINLKQAPIFAPLGVLDDADKKRLDIDPNTLAQQGELLHNSGFVSRLLHAWHKRGQTHQNTQPQKQVYDIDTTLYDAFVPRQQQHALQKLAQALATEQDHHTPLNAIDDKWQPLAQQYIYRHYPDALSQLETVLWQGYVCARNAQAHALNAQEQPTLRALYTTNQHNTERALLDAVATHNRTARMPVIDAG